MIGKYLTLLLIFGVNIIFSQDKKCDCIDELNEASALIKNSKSYKYEIKKKDRVAEFSNWKNEIKREILSDSLSEFFCVGYLQKYISFINDRHNQIYFVPENISTNIPTYSKVIDTTIKGNDEISGIYYAGSDKILVKKENDSVWYGITLKSNSEEWTKGKIHYVLTKQLMLNLNYLSITVMAYYFTKII